MNRDGAPLASDRPLKILVGADVPPDPDSGAAGTVYRTNEALRKLGHDVDEIWASDLGRSIQHGNLHYLAELPFRYKKLVRQRCALKAYDVVQLSQPHAFLAAKDHQLRGHAGIFVNRSHGLELRVESVLPQWESRFGINEKSLPKKFVSSMIQRRLAHHWQVVARYSDGIVLPSEDDRKFLIEATGIHPDKAITIHHGVNEAFLQPAKPDGVNGNKSARLLYVGQYSFIKGPMVLCEVANQVLGLHEYATLTWVCDDCDHKEVLAQIEPGVRPRVKLLGWMPQEQLHEVFADHGIFLFPSFFEGAGKAALEAMASGLCVVASDTGGMRDYIRHGETGFLVPVGGVREMVSLVAELVADSNRATGIGEKARLVSKDYTWQRCARQAVDFYRLLISRKGHENESE